MSGNEIVEEVLLTRGRRVMREAGICEEVKSVTVEDGMQNVIHMNSDCEFLRVEFEEQRLPISLFVKRRPTNNIHRRRFVDEYCLFEKEATFYTHLLPDMKAFWRERAGYHSPLEKVFARIYAVDKEAIHMENLFTQDYHLLLAREWQMLTFEQARLVLAALALFHGTTYTMIRNSGVDVGTFRDKYGPCFKKSAFADRENFIVPYFDRVIPFALRILKECDRQGSEETATFLRPFEKNMFGVFCRFTREEKQVVHVVNHGDCHVNNLLFQKGGPHNFQNVKIVDLQTLNLTSPAHDLNYFIHATVYLDDIKLRLRDMLKFYFDEFKDIVTQKLGETMGFTFEDFVEDYKKHSLLGLLQAIRITAYCAAFHIFTIKEEEDFLSAIDGIPLEKKLKVAERVVNLYEEYRDRKLTPASNENEING